MKQGEVTVMNLAIASGPKVLKGIASCTSSSNSNSIGGPKSAVVQQKYSPYIPTITMSSTPGGKFRSRSACCNGLKNHREQ
jgi:hypothetical protein